MHPTGSSTGTRRPDSRPCTRTIVVCGDSTASPLGLPQHSLRGDYPSLLRTALRPRGVRVISHARPDRSIATTIEELDRVVDLSPDVVVISHGGLENTIRLPGVLRHLPVPPVRAGERRRPLHRARRLAYFPVLLALRSQWSARLLGRSGIGPGTTIGQIHEHYATLIAQLLVRTSAHLVVVTPPTGTMSFQPWRDEGLDRLGVFLREQAETSTRVTVVDLRSALSRLPVFQSDGTHLSAEGHALAVDVVRNALTPSMLAPLPRASERVAVAG